MSGLAVVRDLELLDTALKETTFEIGGKAQIKRGGQKIHKKEMQVLDFQVACLPGQFQPDCFKCIFGLDSLTSLSLVTWL